MSTSDATRLTRSTRAVPWRRHRGVQHVVGEPRVVRQPIPVPWPARSPRASARSSRWRVGPSFVGEDVVAVQGKRPLHQQIDKL